MSIEGHLRDARAASATRSITASKPLASNSAERYRRYGRAVAAACARGGRSQRRRKQDGQGSTGAMVAKMIFVYTFIYVAKKILYSPHAAHKTGY